MDATLIGLIGGAAILLAAVLVASTGNIKWGWAALRILHWVIICNLLAQMAYAAYMVFVVFAPEGTSGPLYEVAKSLPFEEMVTRRLYAIEFWIATVGLSIYLAITEIGPRLRKAERTTTPS